MGREEWIQAELGKEHYVSGIEIAPLAKKSWGHVYDLNNSQLQIYDSLKGAWILVCAMKNMTNEIRVIKIKKVTKKVRIYKGDRSHVGIGYLAIFGYPGV